MPILIWSLGGAWIEGNKLTLQHAYSKEGQELLLLALCSKTVRRTAHQTLTVAASWSSASCAPVILLKHIARTCCLMPAGFTKSHFQHELVLDSSKPTDSGITQTSIFEYSILTPPPTPPAPDPFAKDNAKYRFKNSLNSTHYMLYHELQPVSDHILMIITINDSTLQHMC